MPWPNKRVLIAAFLKPLSASRLHVSQKPQFETDTGDISLKKEKKKKVSAAVYQV